VCPQRLKPGEFGLRFYGTTEQAAEKLIHTAEGGPQALKRGHILNDLAARVKLVPFPRPFELDFFRNL
jgi:hypothetical protein